MLQLLLVDDERSVVETLAETIPWEECGIGTVHEALSGATALEMMENHAIDIVITDIRMPGMSGIELITAIHDRWPHVHSILLSGYAEFEYAKQAIVNQSFDYLLKPVSDEDLIDSVKRLVQRIQEKWEEAASYQKALYTFQENLPLLRSTLLNELLTGKSFTAVALADKLKLLELPYTEGEQLGMLVIRMEEHLSDMAGQDLALIEYAICNIVSEVMQTDFHIWHTRDAHDYIVILASVRQDSKLFPGKLDHAKALLEQYAAQIQTNVQLYLKGAISVLVGSWGQFPHQIRASYEHAVMSMRKRMGQGKGLFVTASDEPACEPVHSIRSLYEPPTLISLLEAGRFDDVEKKLAHIFEELLRSSENYDIAEHMIEVYHVLAGAFSYIIHKNGKQLSSILPSESYRYFQAPSYTTAQQLLDWSIRTLQYIREDSEQELKDNHSTIVRSVKSFVDRHLAEDVSLPAIAEHVHLHPVYLSKVYKAETGEALTAYVYRLRMEKAAFYLRTTTAKVFEVAELVGYNNTAYFIRVFKKFYDVTPQEYRDSLPS
ncbi:AraC family transcriptional regulator [Paenibacillus montaniterrae]|uniref:AraC family transcriptional regulator n=1 Tax=Paenibacillus montaniterrae TaxID=429341 RepID=A0A919YMT5_9BACL|nr:response regulator [Paenibacillus montaniterrae]GIP16120.1 AraC family transcriptional regulator [Paenibacillus montaniterrae]